MTPNERLLYFIKVIIGANQRPRTEARKSDFYNYTNKRKSLSQSIPRGEESGSYNNSRLITSLTTGIKTKQTESGRGAARRARARAGGAILPRIRVINLRNA